MKAGKEKWQGMGNNRKNKGGKEQQGRGKDEALELGHHVNNKHQGKEDEGRREAAKQPTLLPCVAVEFWFSL